jgi:adenylate cyclase
MFGYIAVHLADHALGLISLDVAEDGLALAAALWRSIPATIVLYGAALIHIGLAIQALFEHRTLRLPALELVRIALGLWLPVLLIGHAVSTRLAFAAVGAPQTYARIIGNLWASDGEWWHLGLLAPGWVHGCLGLHFAFGHRPAWRRLRAGLFVVALLLPVLSALGFLEMGRELAREHRVPPPAVAAMVEASSLAQIGATANAVRSIGLWRQELLWGYLGLVGLALFARSGRSLWERWARRQIAVTYPSQRISVPKGWTLLEASRAHHIPHASACGGRGRCSTCRVRILAGREHCPPPEDNERRTLARIAADPDVRLACQLRPSGDVEVATLQRTERQTARGRKRAHSTEYECDAVLLYCEVTNRHALDRDHLAHDVLFVLRRFTKRVCDAVSIRGGTIRFVSDDGVCGAFGLHGSFDRAARGAVAVLSDIDRAAQELRLEVSHRWGVTPRIVVSAHAGHLIVQHLDAAEDTILVAGEALQATRSLKHAGMMAGKMFALSDALLSAAKTEPPAAADVVPNPGGAKGFTAYLTDSAPRQVAARDHSTTLWRDVANVIETIAGS